jgi:signal transduction histidine kinase
LTTVALGALLLAINGLALFRIAGARQEAEETARAQHAAAAEHDARAVESALGSLRADFLFLTNALSQIGVPDRLADEDPFVRRWTRLDAEGRILLFLQSHPAVERISLRDAERGPLVATGRRGGAPILLPPSTRPAPAAADALVRSRWPIGAADRAGAWLDAWIAPDVLLAEAVPDAGSEGVQLRPVESVEAAAGGGPGAGSAFSSRVAVSDTAWEPPVAWTLARTGDGSRLVDSVREVSDRYRETVLFNAILLGLGIVAAALTLREVRRAAREAAERRHREQVLRMEEELRRSERLASLGRMASGIAHEINNPLEGMANWLALVEQDLTDGDTEAARRHGGKVREGLERVAAIVRQVLRLGAGGGSRDDVDLGAIAAETVDLARRTPAGRGRDLRVALPERPAPVRGDAVALGQLVLNLVVNACEAAPDGPVETEVRADEEAVELVVADRGPGLPAADRERLFEPFWSSKGSTGLGLAICHGIATEHGGTLSAEDRPGGGARFRLRLPRAETTTPALSAPSPSPLREEAA